MTEPTLSAEEHPDSPSLSDWHTLYTTTRERFPDGPGLPDGYKWAEGADEDSRVVHWSYNLNTWLPKHAALCVMLDWAIRFGAWWERRDAGNRSVVVRLDIQGWTWSVRNEYGTRTTWDHLPSHHAAYFAAVQAIGERGSDE